jgi:hypothetical protein
MVFVFFSSHQQYEYTQGVVSLSSSKLSNTRFSISPHIFILPRFYIFYPHKHIHTHVHDNVSSQSSVIHKENFRGTNIFKGNHRPITYVTQSWTDHSHVFLFSSDEAKVSVCFAIFVLLFCHLQCLLRCFANWQLYPVMLYQLPLHLFLLTRIAGLWQRSVHRTLGSESYYVRVSWRAERLRGGSC